MPVRVRVRRPTAPSPLGRLRRVRLRRRLDPAGLGSLRGRPVPVRADDGVSLYAEVDDPGGAAAGAPDPVTVVFCHGYALSLDAFHFQRQALRGHARLVLWDQRGHGRSGRGPREHATIDQLGRDLRRVVEETAPGGPLVLVGHSMGGMTVMALAEHAPALVRERVAGVALLSTSPGRLAEVTLGVPAAIGRVARRAAPYVAVVLGRTSRLAERGRRVGAEVEYLLTCRYAFSSPVPQPVADFAAAMFAATPLEVLVDLFPAFDAHDKLAALDVLRDAEALLLCGEDDLVTPPDHTRDMLARLPGAELVLVHAAGHLVPLEHPEVVNRYLLRLLERAAGPLRTGAG